MRRAAAVAVASLPVAAAVDRYGYRAVPRPEALYPVAAAIDNTLFLFAAVAIASALLFRTGRDPKPLLVGAGAAALVAAVLKSGVPAPRPYVSLEPPYPVPRDVFPSLYDPDYASFPSLHAIVLFAAAAPFRRERREYLFAALLVASFVAYSRVLLYVHWVLDVAAGAALGWLCVSLAERQLRE